MKDFNLLSHGRVPRSSTLLRGSAPFPTRLFEREWLCVVSGHGSSPRFNFNSPEDLLNPERYVSFMTACVSLDNWIGYADTVGGDGEVIHVPTFLEENPDWKDNFPFIEIRRPTVGEELSKSMPSVVNVKWA